MTQHIYALSWLLMSIVAPLWMVGIVESPYVVLVPPMAQTGLLLAPSSPCTHLDDCGPFATSFNVTLGKTTFHPFPFSLLLVVANLEHSPEFAYPPVLFASVSHPNRQWWVAGVARTPLYQLNQTWEITEGCFGAPVCCNQSLPSRPYTPPYMTSHHSHVTFHYHHLSLHSLNLL
jgi:hypothetical protein